MSWGCSLSEKAVHLDANDQKEEVPLTERIALSPEEASAVSGIGTTRIREAAAAGVLTAYKHGIRTIILRDDLITWIKGLPSAARWKSGKISVSGLKK